MKLRSRLKLEGLRNIRANVNNAVNDALIKTARKIAADASKAAPKDTTFLSESIHVTSRRFSDYNVSRQSAIEAFDLAKSLGRTPKGRKLGPKSEYKMFPEVRPDSPTQVWIVVGAEHGLANELGLRGRTPFLAPAIYSNKTTLTADIRLSFDGLGVKAVFTPYRVFNNLEESDE